MSPRKASKGNSLRKKAENLLSRQPEDISPLPADDVKKLIHELQVHQIELEMQNEQLRKTESELRESENRYRKLSADLLNAHERERNRIALEVHDGMGASLVISKMKLEAALDEMHDGNHPEKGILESVIPIIQGAIEETRRIQMSLRPPMLDELGILATIDWFCGQFEATYPKIYIKKKINIKEQEVPESLKMVIFRVLQEALNNVAKHSQATGALFYLTKVKKSIQLIVQDNGRGFNPERTYPRRSTQRGLGLGLDSMRERTHRAGGFFRIESRKRAGTVIKATWPIEQHPLS